MWLSCFEAQQHASELFHASWPQHQRTVPAMFNLLAFDVDEEAEYQHSDREQDTEIT